MNISDRLEKRKAQGKSKAIGTIQRVIEALMRLAEQDKHELTGLNELKVTFYNDQVTVQGVRQALGSFAFHTTIPEDFQSPTGNEKPPVLPDIAKEPAVNPNLTTSESIAGEVKAPREEEPTKPEDVKAGDYSNPNAGKTIPAESKADTEPEKKEESEAEPETKKKAKK